MSEQNTYQFQAEIHQLLDILVHSLYTNREIFVRELVSNASDALDKYRFHTNTDAAAESDTPLEIKLIADKEAKTLTFVDTGVGMTADEVRANIGTIAHSGTAELTRMAAEGKDNLENLIGRFGVGFYSVYMVAEKVELRTRSYQEGAVPVEWISDGKSEYTISELSEDTPRGTTITVHLKEDFVSQFTNTAALKNIIRKHSNFVRFPITVDGERVNTVPALWREPKFQITKEQYHEFYTFLTMDDAEPLETIHTSVDAPVQYNALLFVPERDTDFFGMKNDQWGPDLYVRRILIEKQNKELLPAYLSFISGVVDTEDLPLNISRETLQDNVLIRKISSQLTKQVLSHMEKVAKDDADRYIKFWNEHGSVFKTGYMDFVNREKFANLLRFNSSIHEDADGLTSLDEYISRAREEQKEIYFVFGPSREAVRQNPHLEIFRRKGLEVLYLYEPIDEFIMDTLREHGEFKLVAAEHADMATLDKFESIEAAPEVEKLDETSEATLETLMQRMKDVLGDGVTKVRVSKRLSDSPVCLANPDGGMTSSMDKVMRSLNKDNSIPAKILEINPDHPLVRNLIDIYTKDANDPFIEQASQQLYESALLLEGYLTDPHALVGRIQSLLTKSSGWYLHK